MLFWIFLCYMEYLAELLMLLDGLSARNKVNSQGMIHYHFSEQNFGIPFLCRKAQRNKIIACATYSFTLDFPLNNFAKGWERKRWGISNWMTNCPCCTILPVLCIKTCSLHKRTQRHSGFISWLYCIITVLLHYNCITF